jgi:hypothetical protein
MPLRQTTGFVQSLLRLVGLDWAAPDFSTLCRRQKTLNVSLPSRGSTGPLNLLIDSTGIKAEGKGERNARKHGGPKRRIWRKIHIGIDEETMEVRAVEVTTNNIGDAPMLPELLNQIPPDQVVGSVTADGAYDTRKCYEAIAARDANTVIPPRKNAQALGANKRGSHCPKRSGQCAAIPGSHSVATLEWIPPPKSRRNETKIHCIKLLGQSLMARDFERQVERSRSVSPSSTATLLLAYPSLNL